MLLLLWLFLLLLLFFGIGGAVVADVAVPAKLGNRNGKNGYLQQQTTANNG